MAQQDKDAEQSRQQQQSTPPTTQPGARAEDLPKPPQQGGTSFSDWAAI